MGRLRRCAAVAANAYRESVRERVLYNLMFFAVLMMASGLALRSLSIRQDDKIVKDLGLASMELFGDMIAIFIGVGLVSKEIDKRSLYPLLAKPLSRTEFLLGKFAGLSFTLLVNVAIMYLGLVITLAVSGGKPTLHLLKAVYPIYLSLLVIVAVALVSSSLASSAVAGIATTSLVVAGHFSDVIRNTKTILPGAPTWLMKLLYWVIPNFGTFDLKGRVVYGDPVSNTELFWITAYAACYIAVALGCATASFGSRDLK